MVPASASNTSVITDITIDTTPFELGRALQASTDRYLQLADVVSDGDRTSLLVWIDPTSDDSIEAALGTDPNIEAVTRLSSLQNRTLLRIDVTPDASELFVFLRTHRIRILAATGTGDGWRFKLQFPNESTLQAFREFCVEGDIEFTVGQLYHPHANDYGPDFGLTPQQREALLLAVEENYFTVPRECTTADIGETIGISDQAVSERLRRAVNTLVSNTFSKQDQGTDITDRAQSNQPTDSE